jgi:hypothetical protein
MTTTIFVAAEHHRLYHHWKETGARGLRLSHVDFHCDMRGLLIDRAGQRAAVDRPEELERVDQGNFLLHAIREGMVAGLEWVHDPWGGRPYDLGTVRYLTDRRTRLLGAPSTGWMPLAFRERALADWTGPREGEHLDLDWDALACRVYDHATVQRLTRGFLETDFRHRPEAVYFIYSYCSSHIDDDAFEGFLEQLRRKLDARVERLSPLPAEHSNQEHDPPLATRLRRRVTGPLKVPQRWLTERLKRWNGGDDLAFPYAA